MVCIFAYTYVLCRVLINSCSSFQNSLHGNQNRNIFSCSKCSLTQKVYVGSCTLGWKANFSFVMRTTNEVSSFTSLNSTCPTAGRVATNHFPTGFYARTVSIHFLMNLADVLVVVEQHPGPHAPLLNKPLDFCLCVKKFCFRTSLDDTAKLRTPIIDAIRSAAKKMLTYRGA